MKLKLKKNVKKIIFYSLELIFIGLIIFSCIKIGHWWLNSKNSEKIVNELKEAVIIKEEYSNDKPNDKFIIDFDLLKSKNKDTVAWLKVYGTNIEFPIVKTTDNEYYLTHSFDRSNNYFGWPFINYINKFDGNDKNITIFGHGILNGSMFGTLKNVIKEDWQRSNNAIILVTENGANAYQVFSTYKVEDEALFFKAEFNNEQDFEEFISTVTKRSNHNYGVEVTKDDQILTLATCDINDHYRIVLHAKKIINEDNNEQSN